MNTKLLNVGQYNSGEWNVMCYFHRKKGKYEVNCLSSSLYAEMQSLFVYDAQINASKITSLEKSLCLTFWIFFTANPDF